MYKLASHNRHPGMDKPTHAGMRCCGCFRTRKLGGFAPIHLTGYSLVLPSVWHPFLVCRLLLHVFHI